MNVDLQGHAGQVPPAPLRGRVGRLQPDPHRPRVRQAGRPAREHPARPLHDGPGRARQRRGGGRRPARAQAAVGPVPRDGLPRAGDHGDRLGQGGARRPRGGRDRGGAGRQADHPQRRGRAPDRRTDSAAARHNRAWISPSDRASSCGRWSRDTCRSTSPWARSGSPSRTTSRGARRRCAPSWPGSRRSGCSSIRTPRPAACPPTAATASTWTRCSWRAGCRCPARRSS